MVRMYVRKTTRGSGGAWTLDDMNLAVDAVRNGMSYSKATTQYNVPRSTLALKTRGWKGRKSTSNTLSGGKRFTLAEHQENLLAECLKVMSKWGFGLRKEDVLNVVQDYVIENNVKNNFKNNRPGREWFVSFCQRHKLSVKKPELLESSRSRPSNDPFVINNFYDQLMEVYKDLKLENRPNQIYNCDESGFRSDPTTTKVVAKRGEAAKRVTGGNGRKTTTVLACVNAVGKKLPPLILHKGKRLWNTMIGENAFPGTSYSISENGWMTEEVFHTWFQSQFITEVKERPVLLLYDGHLSHVGIKLIRCAMENDVTILKLPPHTSHILQPLDVSVFKGVKSKWDSVLVEWTRHNYGKSLPKPVFANILGKVWTGVEPTTISKGFQKCEIFDAEQEFPVNRSKIKETSFDPEKLIRYKESTKKPAALMPKPIQVQVSGLQNLESTPTTPAALQASPGVSFEKLLLKTVTPVSNTQATRKKRIENAAIITNDAYLKQLELQKSQPIKQKSKKTIRLSDDKENKPKQKKRVHKRFLLKPFGVYGK